MRLECKGLVNELAERCAKDERAMHAVIALRVRLASQAADICGILADTAAGRMTGQAELPVNVEQLELHPAQREKMRQSLRRVADDSLDEEQHATTRGH